MAVTVQVRRPGPLCTGEWIVHTKGGPNQVFEIAVVRSDNHHGFSSHGWFDEDKVLISSSGGPCRNVVSPEVWHGLVSLAEMEAKRLNEHRGK